MLDVCHDPIPCPNDFTIEIVDHGRQPIVDEHTVLARLGEKGVAEDTLIVGILLDCRQSGIFEVGDLPFQRRRLDGLTGREIVQPSG